MKLLSKVVFGELVFPSLYMYSFLGKAVIFLQKKIFFFYYSIKAQKYKLKLQNGVFLDSEF